MYYNTSEEQLDSNNNGNGDTDLLFSSAHTNSQTHNELQHPMDTSFSYFNLDDASFLSNSMPSSEFLTESWRELHSHSGQPLSDATLFSPPPIDPLLLPDDILLSDPSFLRSQVLHSQQIETFEQIDHQKPSQHQNSNDNGTQYTAPSNYHLKAQAGISNNMTPPMTSSDLWNDHGTTAATNLQQTRSPPYPQQQLTGKKARRSFIRRSSRPNPIPIIGNSGGTQKQASSIPTEVDHQRRLSELQARFRINYARKSPTGRHQSGSQSSSQPVETGVDNSTTLGSSERNNNTKTQAGLDVKNLRLVEKQTSLDSAASRRPSATSSGSGVNSRTMPIQIQRVHRPSMSQVFDAEQHQRRLDDQLARANIEDITVTELKEILRQRGRPATGKKAVLLQRLQDERALVNTAQRGHRLSQPPPASNYDPNIADTFHPRSFQNTLSTSIPRSPSVPRSPQVDSPSSVQFPSGYFPSSPGSFSLNHSIANMHIGSPPPAQQSAYHISPYASGTPSLGPLSPQHHDYSASMPTSYFSSSPNSFVGISASLSTNARPMNGGASLTNANYNASVQSHTYAPFTSSSLATPDHEVDCDPFEELNRNSTKCEPIDIKPSSDSLKMEDVDWLDPSIENLFQQASVGTLAEMDRTQDIMPRTMDTDYNDMTTSGTWRK